MKVQAITTLYACGTWGALCVLIIILSLTGKIPQGVTERIGFNTSALPLFAVLGLAIIGVTIKQLFDDHRQKQEAKANRIKYADTLDPMYKSGFLKDEDN